ncbi:hypothetical protein F5984_11875 [Rudanella paleaurantiibacter]|uniref:Tetratricopeptide repeat protein n=1 Tax=Rudanella paleaurantiibacter TaxID=2614655 RepID=A0A7J5U1C2_9BACT|nr:hypothetical protein [Rudanella paleaurantiibacter]KAB7731479.1 hypothetical protein F5984_11875 [Rudanella paleaurantiibacter]
MKFTTEVLEQIERYLANQLPDTDRRAIEERMEKEPAFRETVQSLQRTQRFAQEAELIRMARAVMTQLDAEPMPEPVPEGATTPSGRGVFWRLAMAAILLLVGGVYLIVSEVSLANADLNAGVHRDAVQTPRDELRPAEQQALDQFIRANAYYTDGNFATAVSLYEKAARAPISPYLREAIWWNLSLACLKLGAVDKARWYWSQYEAIEHPRFPGTLLDRTRIRVRIFWRGLFD